MRWRVLLSLVALVACNRGGDEGLRAHGTVEARTVSIASRTGGKVAAVEADEGDRVDAGAPIVRLDLRDLEQERARAAAAARAAGAREALLQEGPRREDILAARRRLQEAQERAANTKSELDRAEKLASSGSLPPNALDDARTAHAMAEATVGTLRAELQKLLRGARVQELEEAAAARQQAEAAVAALDVSLEDRIIESPVAGTVLHRLVEPGEVIRPAQPLLEIGELGRPYIDVYVPEPNVGLAQPGRKVEVRVDALPDRIFEGVVRTTATEAEFTPKNIQTADQRARLVFRVRVDVKDTGGLLHPGMPGSVVFR